MFKASPSVLLHQVSVSNPTRFLTQEQKNWKKPSFSSNCKKILRGANKQLSLQAYMAALPLGKVLLFSS